MDGRHQASVPADALASQDASVVWNFGPYDRRRLVHDSIGDLVVDVVAVQSHGQVHVFTHVPGREAADSQHCGLLPYTECPGNVGERVQV